MNNDRIIDRSLTQTKSQSSITRKFSLAAGGLLLLIAAVAATSFFSLKVVRHRTESAIISSIKMQRLVFEMNKALDRARVKEREFFDRWQTVGLQKARTDYAVPFEEELLKVQQAGDRLQGFLARDTSDRQDLLEYTQKIQEYQSNFRQAIRLVGDLGEDGVGLLARTERAGDWLKNVLQLADEPELISDYNEMQVAEQKYRLNNREEDKTALALAVEKLREAIADSQGLSVEQKQTANEFLSVFESEAQQSYIRKEDVRAIGDTLDRQTSAFSDRLFDFANQEVERARLQIEQTSEQMTVLLLVAVVAAGGFGVAIVSSFRSALEQLEEEREKSERLLLNVLPLSIAQRLKQGAGTIADSFESVTVLFADIAGFTKLSATVSPTDLVQWLNEIFSEFDSIAAEADLEKIKTIGDAYMVVGGLPHPRNDHAEAIAEMALKMQEAINLFNRKRDGNFQMRIGINSGPVVAGVIGTKKFIYDLWGDTVNTASRMESHGAIGEIQVTEATYELLKDKYQFEERGAIAVKGKGEMPVYLLKGKKENRVPEAIAVESRP
jgi:class 3 adenylate cyclase